jgi:hypothetical protein
MTLLTRHIRYGGGVATAGVTAPTAAWSVGTVVGPPTGTSFTATTGLPAQDTTTNYVLRHPVSGVSATRLATPTWQNRSWNAVIELGGVLGPTSGNSYLFRNCLFSSSADFRAVEVLDANATPGTQMIPLVIFDRCTITGNDVLGRALTAGAVWLNQCHLTGAEDAFGGGYWSVATQCNFIATTDGAADPHQDGVQIAGVGLGTFYRCWMDAGPTPEANSAFRAGTDFSAIAGVQLYYNGFARGGYNVQLRGDPGARGITGVEMVGNRWLPGAGFGPIDSVDTTYTAWSNNRYTTGGIINQPA